MSNIYVWLEETSISVVIFACFAFPAMANVTVLLIFSDLWYQYKVEGFRALGIISILDNVDQAQAHAYISLRVLPGCRITRIKSLTKYITQFKKIE